MSRAQGKQDSKVNRQESAAQTRRDIIAAARKLFAEQGYSQTTVNEVARLAKVAPITVYTVVGGKVGLLRILMENWSAAPGNETSLAEIRALQHPQAVLESVARVVRSMREEFGDITYFMQDAAPHDPEVAASLAIATARYRRWFVLVAEHLASLGALRPDLTRREVTDTLWFYFGYWGYYTLHNENGMSYTRAERWLLKAATQALLSASERSAPPQKASTLNARL